MRKAQAAMEFLMTYGWAILVVLAAIGALAYFGVFSTDSILPSKCQLNGGINCVDYKIDGAADEVRFNIINNLGTSATNLNVTLTLDASNPCDLGNGVGVLAYQTVASLENGQRQAIVFACQGGTELPASGRVNGDITVEYQRSGESESHPASGSIQGPVE